MPSDGALVPLPMSPCTDGSLGFDSEFLMNTYLKSAEDLPTVVVTERAAATCVSDEVKDTDGSPDVYTGENGGEAIEDEDDEEDDYDEDEVIEEHEILRETEDNVMKSSQDNAMKGYQGDTGALADHAINLTVSAPSDNVEDTCTIAGSQCTSVENSFSSELDTITNPGTGVETAAVSTHEKKASNVPKRPVTSGMATNVQTRSLTAASLALKKQQAAENAAAALMAITVGIPDTDSISNRIKMFGGASLGRASGRNKKFNVREIVQKYNDVEDKRVAEEITHVERGHQNMEPRGVCSAYALSTASRTALRPVSRRKMSHELNENETREAIVKGAVVGGMVVNGRSRYEEDRMGVSQESVQSVKNAKSIFESLARC